MTVSAAVTIFSLSHTYFLLWFTAQELYICVKEKGDKALYTMKGFTDVKCGNIDLINDTGNVLDKEKELTKFLDFGAVRGFSTVVRLGFETKDENDASSDAAATNEKDAGAKEFNFKCQGTAIYEPKQSLKRRLREKGIMTEDFSVSAAVQFEGVDSVLEAAGDGSLLVSPRLWSLAASAAAVATAVWTLVGN